MIDHYRIEIAKKMPINWDFLFILFTYLHLLIFFAIGLRKITQRAVYVTGFAVTVPDR